MNGKGVEEDSGGSTVEGKPAAAPPAPPKVGLFELFKFSTPFDAFLIISGVCLGKSMDQISIKTQKSKCRLFLKVDQ
jgi:hypothetical protein